MKFIKRYLEPAQADTGGSSDPPASSQKATTPVPTPQPQPDPSGEITPQRHKSLIPGKQVDLAAVGLAVAASWALHPELTLRWILQVDFAKEATLYDSLISKSIDAKSTKSPDKSALDLLDDSLNAGVKRMKYLLEGKFTKPNAPAQYPRYGVSKKGNGYKYPTDRETRLKNLDLIIKNIVIDGFDKDTVYGLAFWTKLKADYKTALDAFNNNDAGSHDVVGNKNQMAKNIRKVLRNLLKIIDANYLELGYSTALSMGFRKTGQ